MQRHCETDRRRGEANEAVMLLLREKLSDTLKNNGGGGEHSEDVGGGCLGPCGAGDDHVSAGEGCVTCVHVVQSYMKQLLPSPSGGNVGKVCEAAAAVQMRRDDLRLTVFAMRHEAV